MYCHQVDYELFGRDMQIVEVELDPGETVIAEAGAMNYMDDGIAFEARMGDGSQANGGLLGKMLHVGNRVLTKESIFLTHFTNQAREKKRVAFAAPYPGKIIPIDMDKVGGGNFLPKRRFPCCSPGYGSGDRFYQTTGNWLFRRGRVHPPATARRRHGLYSRRWHRDPKEIRQ